MIQAKDIMNSNIRTVDPDDTIEEVMSQMIEHGISGLPVVDMSGQLVGIVTEFDLLDLAAWKRRRHAKSWQKTLAGKLDAEVCEKIRLHTSTSRPLGSTAFVTKLEKKFRRRLRALPVGRPKL